MAQEKRIADEESIERLLEQSYEQIRAHDLDAAILLLERGLSIDFDNDEVVGSLKIANFWKDRQETLRAISDDFGRGEYLLSQWKLFLVFLRRVEEASERCMYAVRRHVFGQALASFQKISDDVGGNDVELLLRVSRCHKGIGEYDRALECLEKASKNRREDAAVLAELADCYALVNDVQISKAFFREAFFLDPQRIDLSSLESEMIRRLVAKVQDLGHESPFLEEWLPVYGVLFGIFTVKRELRSIEYGKLKQSIYALEHEIQDKKENEALLVPRLINRYFWLVDHYVSSGEDRSKIDEVLLKLRQVSPAVHQQYTN